MKEPKWIALTERKPDDEFLIKNSTFYYTDGYIYWNSIKWPYCEEKASHWLEFEIPKLPEKKFNESIKPEMPLSFVGDGKYIATTYNKEKNEIQIQFNVLEFLKCRSHDAKRISDLQDKIDNLYSFKKVFSERLKIYEEMIFNQKNIIENLEIKQLKSSKISCNDVELNF